ncbi:MAG: hypothetical protein R8K54_07325 [Mariprofundaceae bacterium]
MNISESEFQFSKRAIKRKKLFLVLSAIGVIIGFGLAALYIWQFLTQPNFAVGIHAVLVILILLISRLNLRQHYFAKILEKVISEK